jgi:hypothetical protein
LRAECQSYPPCRLPGSNVCGFTSTFFVKKALTKLASLYVTESEDNAFVRQTRLFEFLTELKMEASSYRTRRHMACHDVRHSFSQPKSPSSVPLLSLCSTDACRALLSARCIAVTQLGTLVSLYQEHRAAKRKTDSKEVEAEAAPAAKKAKPSAQAAAATKSKKPTTERKATKKAANKATKASAAKPAAAAKPRALAAAKRAAAKCAVAVDESSSPPEDSDDDNN